MLLIILLMVYILSVISQRYEYRLCSSKHYDLWLNEDCTFSLLWIIPIVNTLVAIGLALFIITTARPNKKYKSKWFNEDLLD